MKNLTKIKEKIVAADFFIQNKNLFQDKTTVFTNGCFDILHKGHVEYLAAAKDQGDLLIVGLNSDTSIRRLKGCTRPINDEQARATMLAALSFVDFIIVFEEDTPLHLIQQLLPNVLVKGGDYTINNIVGADIVLKNGGKVEIIPLTPCFSTTNIIKKSTNNFLID